MSNNEESELRNLRENLRIGIKRVDCEGWFEEHLIAQVYGPKQAVKPAVKPVETKIDVPKPVEAAKVDAKGIEANSSNKWDVLNYIAWVVKQRAYGIFEVFLTAVTTFNRNHGSPMSDIDLLMNARYHWNQQARAAEIAVKRQNRKKKGS